MSGGTNGDTNGGLVSDISETIAANNPTIRVIDKGIDAVVKIYQGRKIVRFAFKLETSKELDILIQDPAVLEALAEQRRLRDENHKIAVEHREAARREHNANMERAQNAADANLEKMRLEEKESIEKKQEQMHMNYKEDMKNLSKESTEKRKADEENQKMDSKAAKALEKQQNESNENYKKAMELREAARKEENAYMERTQKAADENLKQMRLDEKESLSKKREKIYMDYTEDMKNLKSESAEKREADRKHQEKDTKTIQILKTQQKVRDAAHDKEVERREAANKEQDAYMEKAQKAADEYLRLLKAEEKKIIGQMQIEINADQAEFEKKMEKRNQDHIEEMKVLKSESLEKWKAADAKHQIETERIRAAHDEEIKNANKQLEEAKKLGLQRIQDGEKELQNIEQERVQQNKLFYKEMKEMEKNHQEEKRKLLGKEFELKKDSIEQRRKQASIENKQKTDQLDQLFNDLKIQNTTTATKDLLKQFQTVVQTTEKVLGNLKTLSICCISDSPQTFKKNLKKGNVKAGIEEDIDSVTIQTELFKSRVERFEQFKMNNLRVHPEALNLCNDYLKHLKKSMESTKILRICTLLSPAVDRRDLTEIQMFGEDAEELGLQLEAVRTDLTSRLNNFQKQFVVAAPTQAALED
ncbi:hypothetical protein CAEBREN_03384 [Caenorhabditis brenneri]|uniref:Uncharacterized protein n=1 Tax=Caenorhabditis brenneri TaxID=135651 RepID=G0M948_CAEBE|nr:hypothetical protein CAEBREN_03384 [Caenorhabditis brenneri]